MAIDSNEVKRHLPYPLDQATAIERSFPQTTPEPILPFSWQTENPDEIVSIRLDLSQNEYSALADAVDVGSDIAFNKDAQWIWDIWTKAFRGAIATMSCEDVADCIESDSGTQQALNENTITFNDETGLVNPDKLSTAGTESTTIINNRFVNEKREETLKPVECDLDIIWSGIYFMVDQLDATGRDWLEQAVASGDKWQRAASIAKNIPIIGSLAETALTQLAEVAQDLLNLYNAYSTLEHKQEIACFLFNLVCAECRYPTYNEVMDYYASNSTVTGGNLAEISLKAMVDFLIGSSTAIAQLAYHTIISMVLFTLYIGSEFIGLRGAKWLAIWCDNGEEFANDEWEVLCDACEAPYSVIKYDFRISSYEFAPINYPPVVGDYELGVGWGGVDVDAGSGERMWAEIQRNFDTDKPTIAAFILQVVRINGDVTGDDRITFSGSYSGGGGVGLDINGVSNGNPLQWYSKGFTPNIVDFIRMMNRVTGSDGVQSIITQIWLVVTPDSDLKGSEYFDYDGLASTGAGGDEYTGDMD